MSLENRVVMITGVTGSLGPTAARRFAERGANLVLVGSSAEKLDALGQSLGSAQRSAGLRLRQY